LYRLDKLIAIGQDVSFVVNARIFFTHHEQSDNTTHPGVLQGTNVLEIKSSDWTKISYDWGKDSVLVPMSPKTHEKLKDALRTNKHLKNIDEMIDELLGLHGNKS
jgi:hypothetical protein